MTKTFAVIMLATTSILFATSAMAASDDFNRAQLGKKWVVPSGTLTINNNALQGSALAIGYFKKSSGDSSVSATVTLTSTDLEYGAVASGDIASGNNAFVKIQSNGDGQFENGAFYVGNNGSGDFFTLDAPVPSPAKLSVSFCGTVATMTIKSSVKTQKYTYDYGTTFGTGGGLGTYGAVALDDYKSAAGGCKDTIGATQIKHATATDPTLKH